MTFTNTLPRIVGATLLSMPMTLATPAIASANDLTFLLYNETSADIVELYISPTTVDDWEENLIPEESFIPTYESVTVTIEDGRTDCEYDILGIFSDGDEVDDYAIDLCELESYSFIEE